MTEYALTSAQRIALIEEARTVEAASGDDFAIACNAATSDSAHVQRLGVIGGANSRVVVSTLQSGRLSGTFLHPTEARAFAAAILNAADELDGKTPLVFFPRPIADEDLDDVSVQP